MTPLKSYSDESYDYQEKVYVIGGWMGRPEVWDAFIPKWTAVLKKYGVNAFHTVDCCQGVETFAGWSSAQKVAIMTDLIDLLESSDLLGFAAGVLVEDYNEVLADKADRNLFADEPYFLAFQEYIGYLTDFASDHYTEAMIDFVFDDHAEFKNKAHSIYNSVKQDTRLKGYGHFGDLLFKHDNEVIPLQAADLLSYETHLALHRKHYPSSRPERRSYARLKEIRKLLRISYYDAKTIKIILDLKKEDLRQGQIE